LRINTGPALIGLRTEENLREALKTIKTPVLMLGGTEDVISTPELMIRTAKCLPNCKLVIHSGYGHVLDIFEELADDAVRFYDNVVNTGRYYAPVDNTPIEGVL
jgi:pimeloyl-ACP methyl ester carboxylesterase